MTPLKTVAISIGDLNGIGFEIALQSHNVISTWCTPLYCVDYEMAQQASHLLNHPLPENFFCLSVEAPFFTITAGKITKESGAYSYASFRKAIECVQKGDACALVTLPIHKKSWEQAKIPFKGHTDVLRALYGDEGIMMLGCEEMFIALFTDHIPLKKVPKKIQTKPLISFLLTLHHAMPTSCIGVLGLNPHAGDYGVLGKEERKISKAIEKVNASLGEEKFFGPLVPDTAFTPENRKKFTTYVAMYHDQGLIPLKALYFDQSINVTLGLPLMRTSVDHGTAFDKAYCHAPLSLISYKNAILYALFGQKKGLY